MGLTVLDSHVIKCTITTENIIEDWVAKKEKYLNICAYAHFYILNPVQKGHKPIMLHANFSDNSTFNEK